MLPSSREGRLFLIMFDRIRQDLFQELGLPERKDEVTKNYRLSERVGAANFYDLPLAKLDRQHRDRAPVKPFNWKSYLLIRLPDAEEINQR